jgi:uncharacterized protein (DUF2237 family)
MDALKDGVVAPVILEGTHEKILEHLSLETLVHHAYQLQ